MPTRDIEKARKAYEKGDVDEAKAAHDANKAQEAHKTGAGNYVKSVVYGGLDGIITTFAVVAGVGGADLAPEVVLILGFANLFADGISMGFGDYLSSQAELEYTRGERRREMWEVENYIEGEKQEMVELYVEKGLSEEDAETVVDIISKDKDIFVDIMMVEELGLMPPDDDESPAKNGLVTFGAFLIFGVIPLLAFLSTSFADENEGASFAISCGLTAVTLFLLGALKGKFVGEQWWKSGSLMLLNGTLAAGSSYLIGYALAEAVDLDTSSARRMRY